MDEIKDLLAGGPWAILGGVVTAVGAGFAVVRKYIRTDKVEGAATGAQLDVIEQLRTLLKEANERADLERKRADEAFAARNEALVAVGELKTQVAVLNARIETLQMAIENGKGNGLVAG